MIFQHTIDKVLSGEKTQTRRLFKAGDIDLVKPLPDSKIVFQRDVMYVATPVELVDQLEITAVERNGRVIWQVGKTYAIQPGRGMKAVGRIEIVSIRREDVRCISLADVKAEGFDTRWDFLRVWIGMHDKAFSEDFVDTTYDPSERKIPVNLQSRSAERYQAWVLNFKLVKAS